MSTVIGASTHILIGWPKPALNLHPLGLTEPTQINLCRKALARHSNMPRIPVAATVRPQRERDVGTW
jgi:hypothetical protein